tara:strand:- start:502 stop:783 length:282 start_codon:yes stop_codon:yes gene_type:complete
MTKSEKKLERSIIQNLTDVCEIAKSSADGFQWLTHKVNYKEFPQSLKVICYFDSHLHSDSTQSRLLLQDLCLVHLLKLGIDIKKAQVRFDVER